MHAFTSARYTVPLGHHPYPMAKYRLAPERLGADGLAQRFLVIDLDVHQGNGTAALCETDADVFTFSMHGENNYPARKERSSWDIALPDRTPDEQYLDILGRALSQLPGRFTPE